MAGIKLRVFFLSALLLLPFSSALSAQECNLVPEKIYRLLDEAESDEEALAVFSKFMAETQSACRLAAEQRPDDPELAWSVEKLRFLAMLDAMDAIKGMLNPFYFRQAYMKPLKIDPAKQVEIRALTESMMEMAMQWARKEPDNPIAWSVVHHSKTLRDAIGEPLPREEYISRMTEFCFELLALNPYNAYVLEQMSSVVSQRLYFVCTEKQWREALPWIVGVNNRLKKMGLKLDLNKCVTTITNNYSVDLFIEDQAGCAGEVGRLRAAMHFLSEAGQGHLDTSEYHPVYEELAASLEYRSNSELERLATQLALEDGKLTEDRAVDFFADKDIEDLWQQARTAESDAAGRIYMALAAARTEQAFLKVEGNNYTIDRPLRVTNPLAESLKGLEGRPHLLERLWIYANWGEAIMPRSKNYLPYDKNYALVFGIIQAGPDRLRRREILETLRLGFKPDEVKKLIGALADLAPSEEERREIWFVGEDILRHCDDKEINQILSEMADEQKRLPGVPSSGQTARLIMREANFLQALDTVKYKPVDVWKKYLDFLETRVQTLDRQTADVYQARWRAAAEAVARAYSSSETTRNPTITDWGPYAELKLKTDDPLTRENGRFLAAELCKVFKDRFEADPNFIKEWRNYQKNYDESLSSIDLEPCRAFAGAISEASDS